jgi:hypothetical protein
MMRRTEKHRAMKAEPAADEPYAQGRPSQQPNTALGGAGGGVTPTGTISESAPQRQPWVPGPAEPG